VEVAKWWRLYSRNNKASHSAAPTITSIGGISFLSCAIDFGRKSLSSTGQNFRPLFIKLKGDFPTSGACKLVGDCLFRNSSSPLLSSLDPIHPAFLAIDVASPIVRSGSDSAQPQVAFPPISIIREISPQREADELGIGVSSYNYNRTHLCCGVTDSEGRRKQHQRFVQLP